MKNLLAVFAIVVAQNVVAQQPTYDVTSGNGNGIRFWSSDHYKIHMGKGTEYFYGPVTDYSIKSNMTSHSGRGWTWGRLGGVPVAALNTAGEMKVKGYFESGSRIYAPSFETRKTYVTKIQLTTHDWSGSHALLFNSYKDIRGNGALIATGNASYANDKGSNSGGAGAIFFHGNGGSMDFVISPASTGKDQPIDWGGSKMRILRNGNIGIGTTTPDEKLEVQGNIRLDNYSIKSAGNSRIDFGTAGLGNEDDDIGIYIEDNGELEIKRNGDHMLNISTHFNIAMPSTVKVGIGTTTPDEKLTVNGTIHSTEVKVDLTVPGPDYVFESDYNLRTLEETEQYIQTNKHLPEIPSAKEMEANGVELGEMNMLLLKKIEELTLHVIALKKENDLQQTEIEKLKNDN